MPQRGQFSGTRRGTGEGMGTEQLFLARFFEDAGRAFPVVYEPGQTLAQAVYLSGIAEPPALCSGIALCGRCRMRVTREKEPEAFSDTHGQLPILPEDRKVFSEQELAAGWRLGCRHAPCPGLLVELPGNVLPLKVPPLSATPFEGVHETRQTLERITLEAPTSDGDAPRPFTAGDSGRVSALLAVDMGTTTLEWHLHRQAPVSRAGGPENGGPPVGGRFGEPLAHGVMRNPQIGAGSDVISRLAVGQSPRGREQLQTLTLQALRGLVRRAETEGNAKVSALCLAANPVVTALCLGLDTAGLARAPYRLPLAGGTWENLPGLPPVWVPPQLSPFVGGDISAGYAAVALAHTAAEKNDAPFSLNDAGAFSPNNDIPPHADGDFFSDSPHPAPEYPFLLADLGTNGEFLLALSPQEAITASVALGPALEGIGLRHGIEAGPGAVSGFSLSRGGLEALTLPGTDHTEPAATGITGTGYLALLNLLLKARAMDRDGRFTPEGSPLLRRAFAPSIEGTTLSLPHGLSLSAADVEEILKVKAAFSLGLRRLLNHAGMPSTQIRRVYLAGSLGRHVDKEALENLGFFPPGLRSRLLAVGNAALAGAALLLGSDAARRFLIRWSTGVRGLDLAGDPEFTAHFPEHMRFTWPRE